MRKSHWALAVAAVAGWPPRPIVAAPLSAPLEVLKTRHLVVRATLNGMGPYRMVLDTGSPLTFVSTRVAGEIGMIDATTAKQQPMFGMRLGLTLKSIDVGGAHVDGLSVMVLDHPTVQMLSQVAGPIEGIVGMSFMGRFRMTLDYSANKDRVQQRYPFFRSTFFERRMLFDVAAATRPSPPVELPATRSLERVAAV